MLEIRLALIDDQIFVCIFVDQYDTVWTCIPVLKEKK